MKKFMKYLAAVVVLGLAGCHQPDAFEHNSVQPLTSVTARFATGAYKNDVSAVFTTPVAQGQERIVIDIPYFYPESSDNVISDISEMRVTASLGVNCKIEPALGTLDLSKENYFTVTDMDGNSQQICITGNIKKSSACLIEEFTLPDLRLSGIIDNDKGEITLITIDELPPVKASYRLSYHASIAPDPAVQALDYNNEPELTVTAYDGVTSKKYKVLKGAPARLPNGMRPGSGTLLWAKQLYGDLGIATVNMTGGIAVTEDYILLNTRAENSVILNRSTGERIGEYTLPADVKASVRNFYNTADRAGNILICNLTTNDGNIFKIWRVNPDLKSEPQLWLQYDTGGAAMGRKFSVQGDIDGNAIITAPIHANSQFVRWQVTNGVIGTPEVITATGFSSGTWTSNVDVVSTSDTDPHANYFVTYYGSGDHTAVVDGQTNKVISELTDIIGSNYISNAVDYVTFNDRGYMCFNSVNSFTWGGGGGNFPTTDCCWLLDANNPHDFSGSPNDPSNPIFIMNSGDYMSRTVANGNVANGNGTGDVALYVSSDGYYMYMYMMITNGWIVGWQFDCIDK